MDLAMGDPAIPDGETTRYGLAIGDGPQIPVTATINATDGEYVQRLDLVSEAGPRYANVITYARKAGQVRPEHYELRTFFEDRPVAVEEAWFRDVQVMHFGGRLAPYPRSIMPLLGCLVGLRGIEFRRGYQTSFAIYLANTVFWEIALKVERRERHEVPAGSFDAWRVKVRPSFEQINKQLDRVVGLVLPAFVLHFDAAPPHRMLRFSFPTGPFPWNPRADVAAVSLD